jgi:alpha-L-fucosidase
MTSYRPNRESLKSHPLPSWFQDAKLGIFIHWGLYSVPAFAPKEYSIREILRRMQSGEIKHYESPYAEWYQNNIRQEGTRSRHFHEQKFGADFTYEDFQQHFETNSANWDPETWAGLVAEIGARYVVLTAKHHDGYLLWPSRHPNPFRPSYQSSRDLIGELASSVRSKGIRMGLYYSGGLDWTFNKTPITDISDVFMTIPTQKAYVNYVNAHWRELIERYEPSVLWNDIGMPHRVNVLRLFAEYYNRIPEGVVNDRFSGGFGALSGLLKIPALKRQISNMMINVITSDSSATSTSRTHSDYFTPEYKSFPWIVYKKWESTRGIGRSFGYNHLEEEADCIDPQELVRLLVDIVSKNGNLLLNIGPTAWGEIPALQRRRLEVLGSWLLVNGEAIFNTRYWKRPEGTGLDNSSETSLRYTQKEDSLYALLLKIPSSPIVQINNLQPVEGSMITVVGSEIPLLWGVRDGMLSIRLPEELPQESIEGGVLALKINPQPQDLGE